MSGIIASVDFVVAGRSVSGVCAAAAVLRNAARGAGVTFCEPFMVDKLDPEQWGVWRSVLFVDLASNRRDASMTVAFLRRVTEAGHEIAGVCGQHDGDEWKRSFAAAGLDFEALVLKPSSGDSSTVATSGASLLSLLAGEADPHTRELCHAADSSSRLDFRTHFGELTKRAVEARVGDDTRRMYIARHFALQRQADKVILGWAHEGNGVLRGHEAILAARTDLGGGVARVVTAGRTVDMPVLMSQLYGLGYKVVVVDGDEFQSGPLEERRVGLGIVPMVRGDLVAALKAAGIPVSRSGDMARVSWADEHETVNVVKAALT